MLCELRDWRQPDGGYKEFAARELLLRLEEAVLIELSPRQRVKSNVSKKRPTPRCRFTTLTSR